jgi:hypothetical protein
VDETDTRFCIKTSTLPNAGLGCFAKVPMKKGDWLEVIGVYVRAGSPADHCTHYANRYKFAGSDKQDAYIVPMGYGGMVNHTDDKTLQNCELRIVKNLSKRSQHCGQVVYLAIKDIGEGEELLGNYGELVGKEIEWATKKAETIDKHEEDWKTFLSYDLYNLGMLQERL